MTFTAYIQRQKSLIRSRREHETVCVQRERGEMLPEYDTDKLIGDLTSLKGLNTEERLRYLAIFR